MSYEGTGNLYVIQKSTELVSTGCAILEHFANKVHFPTKELESIALLTNSVLFLTKKLESTALLADHRSMRQYKLTVMGHSTLFGKQVLKEALNPTHFDAVFDFAVPDRNRELDDKFERYKSTNFFLLEHIKKLENMKCVIQRVL